MIFEPIYFEPDDITKRPNTISNLSGVGYFEVISPYEPIAMGHRVVELWNLFVEIPSPKEYLETLLELSTKGGEAVNSIDSTQRELKAAQEEIETLKDTIEKLEKQREFIIDMLADAQRRAIQGIETIEALNINAIECTRNLNPDERDLLFESMAKIMQKHLG